MLGKYGKIK